MNVIYIFDNNYADISGISIYSLLNSNTGEDEIVIYIVDGGISADNKEKLKKTAKDFKRQIVFIPASDPDEVLGISLDVAQWCKTNYIRVYLEHILPKKVSKILYIDSDTLILDSLNQLYNMDMKGQPIAAAYDGYPLPKYQLGFTKRDEYFSDGILLIDLDKLRDMNAIDLFIDFLIKRNGKVPYLEQGAINYVMKNKIELIHPRYNLMTISLVYEKCPTVFFEKTEPFYSEEELREAINSPCIVHLTGHLLSIRPWLENVNHPYTQQWISVMKKSAWGDDFQFRKTNICSIKNNIKFIFGNICMKTKPTAKLIAKNCYRMREINKYRMDREIIE